MKIGPLSVVALSCLLSACSFSVSTGGGSKPAEDDPQSSGNGSSEKGGSAASYTPSAESKAWFEKCSAHYDAFMSEWKPLEDEARTVIAETKDAPFYTAAPRLAGQFKKSCVEGKKGKWGTQGYADKRGTGVALLVAIAKAQLQAKKGAVRLFSDPIEDVMVNNLPTTGDDFVDRNAFCLMVQQNNMQLPEGSPERYFMAMGGQPRNSVHWLTEAERERFNERYKALTKEAADTLQALGKQFLQTGGEVGKVKSVKKQPDGSTLITAKRVETPYECRHTGVYHWDGVQYNDCSYVDRAPVEIYGFTARFADVPPSELKVGDFIGFAGTVGGKVPSNVEMANASWEGLFLQYVYRNKKAVLDIPRLDYCY